MKRHQPQLAVLHSLSRRLAHFTPQTPQSLDPGLSSLHKFSSLVTRISQNPINFAALRSLDSELVDAADRLDCTSLVLVVKGLCKIRKLQRAKGLLIQMRRRFVNVSQFFWYGLVFDCLVRDGRITDVENVWNDVCGNEAEVDVDRFVVYVCRFGDFRGVKRVCERVLKDGKVLSGRSYAALIGALCRNRDDGSLAKEVVRLMDHAGMRIDDLTYYVMYKCYCRNWNLDDADWILRRLVKRGFIMDVFVYGSFLYGLCKSGKIREADKLFRKLLRSGRVEKSSEVDFLRLGRRAIFQLEIGEVFDGMMVYEAYFRSLCSAGQLDVAQKLFKEMMKMRAIPQTCVYACFIKALFKAGRDSDALKFYNLEKKKQHICTDEIIRSVVRGLCEIGRVNDGLDILNEVISKGSFFGGISICNNILSSLWKEKKNKEAETLFERMKSGAYGLPDESTFSIMIHGLCHHGDITEALSLFEKMLERKFLINRVLYEELISELSRKGRRIEAHKLLNSMLENGLVVSFEDLNL